MCYNTVTDSIVDLYLLLQPLHGFIFHASYGQGTGAQKKTVHQVVSLSALISCVIFSQSQVDIWQNNN